MWSSSGTQGREERHTDASRLSRQGQAKLQEKNGRSRATEQGSTQRGPKSVERGGGTGRSIAGDTAQLVNRSRRQPITPKGARPFTKQLKQAGDRSIHRATLHERESRALARSATSHHLSMHSNLGYILSGETSWSL